MDDPQEEGQSTPPPTSKRQGSTIILPEAKKASQPQPPASYRNPKQATVPSEAQMQGQQLDEELEDEAFRQALSRSVVEVRHDPLELPNTGGSAGSTTPGKFQDRRSDRLQ